MASRSQSRQSVKASRPGFVPNWRYLAWTATFSLLAMSLFFGWQQMEQFLIRDPKFIIAPPADYGEESPSLKLSGIQYASRFQVLRVFQQDIGRSLYLVNLPDRRKSLLRLGWVKDASIQRQWPNRLSIQIVERKPVAFLQLQGEAISRWALIDSDGVILDPPDKAPFKLPVITGVKPAESQTMRSLRVRRMRKMMDSVGDLRDRLSEVDTADLDDLKVTMKVGDHAVVLLLGDRNFRSRLQNFLDHYDTIARRIADAQAFDLRLDDRITVVGGKYTE